MRIVSGFTTKVSHSDTILMAIKFKSVTLVILQVRISLLKLFLTALVLANSVKVGLWNKIDHPADSHKQFKQVPMVSAYRL